MKKTKIKNNMRRQRVCPRQVGYIGIVEVLLVACYSNILVTKDACLLFVLAFAFQAMLASS